MAIFALDGEPPSMEWADKVSILDFAERKRHSAMRAAVNQRRQSAIASAKKDDPLPSYAKLHRFFTDIASQTCNRPDIGEIIEQIEFSKQSWKMVVRKTSTRVSVSPMTDARPEPAARRLGRKRRQ